MKFKINQKVSWEWAGNKVQGTVTEIIPKTVKREIKDSEVVRHGSEDNPVIVIKQDDGDEILKLASELEKEEHNLND